MIIRAIMLLITLCFGLFMLILGLTPAAWNAAGRPAESYPELFYMAFGWPAALALMLANLLFWVRPISPSRLGFWLTWIGVGCIAWLCLLMAAAGALSLLEFDWAPRDAVGDAVTFGFHHFHEILIVSTFSMLTGAAIRWRANS